MRVDLTSDVSRWVEAEVASGRSSDPADAVRQAVDATKLARLVAEIRDAEADGGRHSSDDVRAFVRDVLDEHAWSTPGRR